LQVSPDHLTTVLRQNGYLGGAIVEAVTLTPMQTSGIGSDFFRAELRFSSSDHALPNRMVVKRPNLADRGRGEAEAYARILGPANVLPVPTCYGVVDDNPDEGLNLLFDDLSDSHHQTPWPTTNILRR
jgi:hypothetical protein